MGFLDRSFLSSYLGPRVIARASLFLLFLIMALSACAEDQKPLLQGTVSWVYDGDTLEIEEIGKVRLIGIDTPERENSQRDQHLAKQGISAARQREIYRAAKEFNIKHIKGQRVSLSLDQPERDRHGRILAYIHLPDGRILNQLLIEKGLAVVYRRFSFQMKEEFLRAEELARQAEVGLWEKDSK